MKAAAGAHPRHSTGESGVEASRTGLRLSRRDFVAGAGALVVSFALFPRLGSAQEARDARAPVLPGALKDTPMLDAWIRVGADGTITVFTGKVEFGQGVKTALIQLAAEELIVAPARIQLVTADTERTPNEGYTAGSNSMKDSGTAIMNAAAQVREMLLGMAASRFGAVPEGLTVQDGTVRAGDGRSATYAELVAGQSLHVAAQPQSRLRDPKARAFVGKSLPRVDIPGKVTGAVAYVQDLRLPNMAHARIVRPPSYGARLTALDSSAVEKMPGVLKVVRDGSFVAIVAEGEFQAIAAMRALGRGATWDEPATLPSSGDPYAELASLPHDDYVIRGASAAAPAWSIESSYRRPYQMHGSIGPSCAVALYERDKLTVWTHSQGVYPLRAAIAEMLHLPATAIRCAHMEGSGCYGHNAADDAAADAALVAVAFPGRPVRVQWMREHEHRWEPFGSAMVTSAKAALDAQGTITDWQFDVWSGTHSSRPGQAGNLASAWLLQNPFAQPTPKPIPQPEGGGDRNAVPLYDIANMRIVHHFIPKLPLRVSALRSLGAYMNVFSIESFMDELALAARIDPVEFRLRHLKDARAQDVIRLAAERFGWAASQPRRDQGKRRGRGFAFARYKNLGAYTAVAIEADVDRESGRVEVGRIVAAVDSGDAVNPDGIRNQIEGGIVQSLSWSLYEAVEFDRTRIISRDWSNYPIMRFASVPRSIDVHIIERPGTPFLGTGESAQGPAAAALANAIASAVGVRMRELPLAGKRLKAAIGV